VSDEEIALHESGAELTSVARHPNGSLMKTENDPTVWYTQDGERHGIPNPEVFKSRRFRWSTLRTISQEEMGLYPIGAVLSPANFTLVKSDAPEVYFMEDGKRRHIESAEGFAARGFNWGKIVTLTQELVDLIPEGLGIR